MFSLTLLGLRTGIWPCSWAAPRRPKFFHDVTYEHRLRDSTYEMYQFRETMARRSRRRRPSTAFSSCCPSATRQRARATSCATR